MVLSGLPTTHCHGLSSIIQRYHPPLHWCLSDLLPCYWWSSNLIDPSMAAIISPCHDLPVVTLTVIFVDSFNWSVQILHQILESSRSTPTIASNTLKNTAFNTLIIWILRLHDLPSDKSHQLIIFITLHCFSFDLLLQQASMGCLVRCLHELVLLFAIGDNPIITSAFTMFRSEHNWVLTTPPSKSHWSLP